MGLNALDKPYNFLDSDLAYNWYLRLRTQMHKDLSFFP